MFSNKYEKLNKEYNEEWNEIRNDFFQRYEKMQKEIAEMEKEVDELLKKSGVKINN